MKRTGFARKLPPKAPRAPVVTIPRDIAERITYAQPARLSVPVRKAEPLQHLGYMDAVRGLACYRCGKAPRSQFCHADEGKGTAIKSDCRLGWPGCAQCHHEIGTARVLPKQERREWEAEAGRATRAEINRLGLWPKRLPQWLGPAPGLLRPATGERWNRCHTCCARKRSRCTTAQPWTQ